MGTFHQQDFSKRFSAMGDQAEGVFTVHYPQNWVRFGLDRPPINLAKVPPFIRHAPDFLTAKGMVEAQGFGKDQTAKFKTVKLDALHEWHRFFRVDFFLYDSFNRRFGWVRLPELDEALESSGQLMRFENDGNAYWAVPAARLPVVGGWTDVGNEMEATR